MSDWKSIETAPRDGTWIIVTDEDGLEYEVCWNRFGNNAFFQPEKKGIWWGLNGAYTWSEECGCGPTLWRSIKEGQHE